MLWWCRGGTPTWNTYQEMPLIPYTLLPLLPISVVPSLVSTLIYLYSLTFSLRPDKAASV